MSAKTAAFARPLPHVHRAADGSPTEKKSIRMLGSLQSEYDGWVHTESEVVCPTFFQMSDSSGERIPTRCPDKSYKSRQHQLSHKAVSNFYTHSKQ
jgi:hypothetical protein